MAVDVSSVPLGERTLRLLVADAAGNVAARQGTARVDRGGAGSTAADPFARLRSARMSVRVIGARWARHAGRRALVARIGIGRTVTIAGRLRDARARAIAGAEIRARGHRGVVVGRTLTRRDGRFRLVARPTAGGLLAIGVPAGRELLPSRGVPAVVIEVRPRVSLAASSSSAAAGQEVRFTGRLVPAPADIGLGSRKGVVLEWLDPVRGTWRPVVNAAHRRRRELRHPVVVRAARPDDPDARQRPDRGGLAAPAGTIGGDPGDGEVAWPAHDHAGDRPRGGPRGAPHRPRDGARRPDAE